METKLKYSMVALMSVVAMLAYADDKEDYDVGYGYTYEYCDTNKDGTVDDFELKLCDEYAYAVEDITTPTNSEHMKDYDTEYGHDYSSKYCDTNKDGTVDDFELKLCDEYAYEYNVYNNPEAVITDYLPSEIYDTSEDTLSKKDAIISFESATNVGNCLPGQSCRGYVGTADDYFMPTLPGTSDVDVFLFTKDDVDKIVQKKVEEKLQECKNNPESCGIKTFSTSISDLNIVKSQLQNRKLEIKGYYLQFGGGAYDWIYVTPDGNYVAKLEEGVDKKGSLRWSWIQKPKDEGFNYISIDQVNNTIYFGNALLHGDD